MASLERCGKGYRVRWREGGTRKASPVIHGKRLAMLEMQAVNDRLAASVSPRSAVITWNELVMRWALHKREENASDKYIANTKRLLKTLASTHDWHDTSSVAAWHVPMLLASQWRCVRAFLRWAQRTYRQPVDPHVLMQTSRRRTARAEQPLPTSAQIASWLQLAGAVSLHLELAGHLIALYGHRPESLVRLRVGDVDLAAGRLRLTHLKQGGVLPEHPLTAASLRLLRSVIGDRPDNDPLLLAPGGTGWRTGADLAQHWRHHVADGGRARERQIYQLKRYGITRLLRLTQDPKTVQAITGHRTIQSVYRYLRTNEEQKQAAIAALEADADQIGPT